jgi:hypothetical protein
MQKACALEGCFNTFIPKTKNSLYCDKECQKKAALKRYHDAKLRLVTKRQCAIDDCTTVLSIYNKEDICEAHKVERYIQRLVDWGWDEESLRKEIS